VPIVFLIHTMHLGSRWWFDLKFNWEFKHYYSIKGKWKSIDILNDCDVIIYGMQLIFASIRFSKHLCHAHLLVCVFSWLFWSVLWWSINTYQFFYHTNLKNSLNCCVLISHLFIIYLKTNNLHTLETFHLIVEHINNI